MRRLFLEIFILVGLFIITVMGSMWYFNRQFKVFYSLDTHHNDQEIISVIDHARQYVYFAIYTFTRSDIADALIRAQERGVTVWGITDTHQSQMPEEAVLLQRLRTAHIPVETQKHTDGIMHIKAIVTDNEYASGSYNWTTSATNVNDEILEVGNNAHLRATYFSIIKKILITNE